MATASRQHHAARDRAGNSARSGRGLHPAGFADRTRRAALGVALLQAGSDVSVNVARLLNLERHFTNHSFCAASALARSPWPEDSEERRRCLAASAPGAPFAWLRDPVLNGFTRLAVETAAASGELRVQGYEPGRRWWAEAVPATAVLDVVVDAGGGVRAARPQG